jgi:hypothetical protein
MSYSRWGDSFWYTYWMVGGKPGKEIFMVCSVESFLESEIRADPWACAMRCYKVCEETPGFATPTRTQLHELVGYMLDFLEDVSLERTE